MVFGADTLIGGRDMVLGTHTPPSRSGERLHDLLDLDAVGQRGGPLSAELRPSVMETDDPHVAWINDQVCGDRLSGVRAHVSACAAAATSQFGNIWWASGRSLSVMPGNMSVCRILIPAVL